MEGSLGSTRAAWRERVSRPRVSETARRRFLAGWGVPGVTVPRVVGILLLAMATLQAIDLRGFADVLATYRLGPPEVASVLALAFVTAEAVSGAGLLRRRVSPVAALGGLAVALGWSFLAAEAFFRHLTLSNCGCFGMYLGQPLRWWVLLEDADFVLLAALSVRASLREGDGVAFDDKTAG